MSGQDMVVLGRITGLFGIRGWVKVFSHTAPRDNIVRYDPLYVRRGQEWRAMHVADGQAQGKGVVLRLDGFDDRDAAASLIGADLAVRREQLAPLESGEYYWADLEGLRVSNLQGVDFGTVDHLFETGANDVLVVKGERERLIPFLRGSVIHEIDLERREMKVDWDPDF
ncbi:MAG: ribosome maturation factor RimM [Chromatiales bacterium]|jgi:16S rRNA processing protein RimM|nr:ribosome maturation factor RimM [Chromatiales bacterium]MDX9767250.1 ribosome maturation factor RimM [Ectothiorhodospiraceae bacterium]